MRPLRLLFLPNEQTEGDQVGPRMAWEAMVRDGRLSDCRSFSFQVLAAREGAEAMWQALEQEVRRDAPEVLFWQHVGGVPVGPRDLQRLRHAAPAMKILYHEGDMYGRGKPVPPPTARLLAGADAVGLVSRGAFAQWVGAAGRARVLYAPSAVDTRRFGTPWQRTAAPEFDVAMIGNRVRSRLPWRRMPGASRRAELARALGRRFGARFALFGDGWRGHRGWQGPLPYADQEAALRRACCSVGWNHFDDEAGYFSDRLPIALLSGVPHACNRQPGCEALFGPEPPLRWAHTVEGVLHEVDALLALDEPSRAALGERAHEFARRHLVAEVVYPRLLAEAAAAWA